MLFQYPGSKANLAPGIVALMPRHLAYVEPFAGTLSVLYAKRPITPTFKATISGEIVNDLDEEIVNFFRVIRDDAEELTRRCDLTPWSRQEFEDCKMYAECSVTDDPIERAREFWVRRDFSINGTMRGFSYVAGKRPIQLTRIGRMVEFGKRLRYTLIENLDYREIFRIYDSEDTLFYCDPPYLGNTRHGALYAHEMMGETDHEDFARCCNDAKGHVMVSGYPSPEYDEMFKGWDSREWKVISTLTAEHSDGRGIEATEKLWANFPMTTQGSLW